MDFDERLEKAIERGQRMGDAQAKAAQRDAVSEEECKRIHSQYRLALSEHIESGLRRLPDHFPGFRYEAVVGERGWGAAVSRDDVGRGSDGSRRSFFSRLEMTVRPYSTYRVLELTAKGTIRNKEIYNRTHFQRLGEADPKSFTDMIDLWILEYAELYAAKS
ncbi:MAG TPA: hypothetical protein VMV69_21565 [Pirellulales bacterium]|nr:hypothetical protein [Pirellulales bacterium]